MNQSGNKKIICTAIFSVMFLFLLMQFRNVMVYFDDYGYYSLSYGVDQYKGGHDYTIRELLDYLKIHYFEVNGRLPGYLLWLSLFSVGGLPLVQIAAAAIVTAILYLLWKFIHNEEHSALTAGLVCAFYGLICLEYHKQGTYWFAAFFQYVAPVATITLFAIIYFKHRETGFSLINLVVLALLSFVSAFSQEQLGVTVVFMMCLILAYELLNKNVHAYHLCFIAAAVCGAAILLLSPSSQERASGSGYTMFESIVYSTYNTIRTFFAGDMSALVVLLHVSLLSFSLYLFRKDKHVFKLMDFGGIALAVVSILIFVCPPLRNTLSVFTLNRYYALIAMGVPCIAVIAIQIMRYYWCKRQYSRLLLFMTAVGSIGCLCFVPEVPPRLFVPSWLMLFPLLADGIFVLADYFGLKKESYGTYCLGFVCVIVLLFSLSNSFHIYCGYAQNREAYQYNDMQLMDAVESEKAGNQVDEIYLKKMPAPDCAALLIYHEEVPYVVNWMRKYYGLNSKPAFYFSEDGTSDLDQSLYADIGNNRFIK